MAEAVLFNVARQILTKSGSLAVQKMGLRWGVNDAVDGLKSTVSQLQAVLLDAEEKYYLVDSSHQFKLWLGQLRDALYDADDLLDDFSTQILRKQVMGGTKFTKEVRVFFSRSNNQYGLKLAHKIKAIKDRLDQIAKDKEQFKLVSRIEETCAPLKQRDQTHSSLPEIFVGRENDKKHIIEHLCSLEYGDNVVVVPIVGIGGLGKTTLVQSVYNDEEVKTHFELKLWVCVSDNFDVQLIVKKILESATGNEVGNLQMNTLKNKLHEKIAGKKYLLVLDDVWSEDSQEWLALRDLLVAGARGTRILVTTRLEGVANRIGSIPPYKLEGLSKNESWDLFKKFAFKRGQGPSSPSQEEIGEKIIEKCNGVPLAIKTIGCLLSDKNKESEWLSFKNLELSKVQQGAKDILPTLKLSYNHLPSYLKHCFAYCCIFPKDYQIEVTNLIELWMAQGYIIRSNDPTDRCLEDIGYSYCMNLLSRSFLELAKKDDELGKIVKVKMHDLMHDLAIFVAGDELSNIKKLNKKTRHLSIDSGEDFPSLEKGSKLRTILLNIEPSTDFTVKQCNCLVSNLLSALRVLDLSNSRIKEVPHSIGKLKHLRYLNLSWNSDIKELPKSITQLHNLQVLNLNHCYNLRQLPRAIHKLVNLMRLYINRCDKMSYMPCGIGKLALLSELSKFVVANPKDNSKRRCSGLGELRRLSNLRGSLKIENLQFVEKSASSEFWDPKLSEKQHLRKLTLNWVTSFYLYNSFNNNSNNNDNDAKEEIFEVMEALHPHPNLKVLKVYKYGGVMFPSWLSSLTNLTSLKIKGCMKIQHLPPLQDLFCLGSLEIWDAQDLEYIDDSCNINNKERVRKYTPSLKKLILEKCPNLKGWWSTIEAEDLPQFHCLSCLRIGCCPNLTSIPLLPNFGLKSLLLSDACLHLLHQIFEIPQPLSSIPSSSHNHLPSQVEEQIQIVQQHLHEESSFRHLTSIKRLHFYGSGIATLYRAMKYLISLEDLTVGGVEALSPSGNEKGEEENDDMQWQGLRSLQMLTCQFIENWACPPKGLEHVTTLHYLLIDIFEDLVCLPEWVGKLPSLQYLGIYCHLHLKERCGNNKGEDWPLIAHIPNINICGVTIQKGRNYMFQSEESLA